MVANKNRLYVAVYPSDETPDDKQSFNWGFLIGPKTEDKVVNPGMRYHVERVRAGTAAAADGKLWRYAETVLPSVSAAARMYARLLVAKITDEDALVALLRNTRPPPAVPGDEAAMARRAAWSSRLWVAEVFARLSSPAGAAAAAIRGGKKRGRWSWAGIGRLSSSSSSSASASASAVVGTAVLDWPAIERVAGEFVAEKMAAGRYEGPEIMQLPKPTWDMLLDRETVP